MRCWAACHTVLNVRSLSGPTARPALLTAYLLSPAPSIEAVTDNEPAPPGGDQRQTPALAL